MINSHQTHVMFSNHVLSFFFLLYCECTKNVAVYVQSLLLANWNASGNHSTVSIFKGNRKIFKRKFIKRKAEIRKDDGYENTYFISIYLGRQNQAMLLVLDILYNHKLLYRTYYTWKHAKLIWYMWYVKVPLSIWSWNIWHYLI